MPQTKPDLVVSDLLTEVPLRKLVINVADVRPGRLTLMEALDIAEASGFDADDFTRVLQRGTLRQKARLLYAFAWVVARRIEPDLTYEEVCTYQLDVKGEPASGKDDAKRAEAVVAVAALAGVSPDEAEQMTIAEVQAVSDLHRKRNVKRAAAPRRRRVG